MNAKEVFENIGPPDDNGCKPWLRARSKSGYGYVRYGGRHQRVNRVVWQLLRGPIPDGLCVCHVCDHPLCCNIDHLFLATQAGNQRDRHNKGRTATGSAVGNAKLDEADVLFMRCLHAGGMSVKKIAAMYNVEYPHADSVIHGRSWAHLPLAVARTGSAGENNPSSRLTESKVREAFLLREKGLAEKEIATRLSSKLGAIHNALRGLTWAHLGFCPNPLKGRKNHD